jgi:hypothetical protein
LLREDDDGGGSALVGQQSRESIKRALSLPAQLDEARSWLTSA